MINEGQEHVGQEYVVFMRMRFTRLTWVGKAIDAEDAITQAEDSMTLRNLRTVTERRVMELKDMPVYTAAYSGPWPRLQ